MTQHQDAVITDTSSATIDTAQCDTVTISPVKGKKGQWRWSRTSFGTGKKVAGGEVRGTRDDTLTEVIRVNRAPYLIHHEGA